MDFNAPVPLGPVIPLDVARPTFAAAAERG
jgi:hypothetical protein